MGTVKGVTVADVSVPYCGEYSEQATYDRQDLMEDERTQRAIHAWTTGQAVASVRLSGAVDAYGLKPSKTFLIERETAQPTSIRGPLLAVVARNSGQLTDVEIGLFHLQNFIVGLDWLNTRRHEEQNDPSLPVTPQPATIQSFVEAKPAWHPFPVHHNQDNSRSEQHFIQMLEQAYAEGREVIILGRGISGHTVLPDAYRAILMRFRQGPSPLVVRLAFALRNVWVQHANYLEQPNRPFFFRWNAVPSARGLHHTELINIRTLIAQDDSLLQPAHGAAQRIIDWFREEQGARLGWFGILIANFIKHVRGGHRNRITL